MGSQLPDVRSYLAVSCLSDLPDVFESTAGRLSLGDHVVIHSERGTDTSDGAPVARGSKGDRLRGAQA